MHGEITQALDAVRDGKPKAREQLFDLVKGELGAMAHRYLAKESPGNGLQTTMLMDDVFLKLLGDGEVSFENRRHFFGAAAEAVYRLLIENARMMSAQKRGGRMNRRQAEIDLESPPPLEAHAENWESLGTVLKQLEAKDARAWEVVRLRFFAGLSEEQVAKVVGVTDRTVRRDWVYAKAWLAAELRAGQAGEAGKDEDSGETQ